MLDYNVDNVSVKQLNQWLVESLRFKDTSVKNIWSRLDNQKNKTNEQSFFIFTKDIEQFIEESTEQRLQTKLEVHRNRQLMQKIEYLNSQIEELVQEKKTNNKDCNTQEIENKHQNSIDDFITTDRDSIKLKFEELLKDNQQKNEKIEQLTQQISINNSERIQILEQELENSKIEKKEILQKQLKISKELNDSKIELNILQSTCQELQNIKLQLQKYEEDSNEMTQLIKNLRSELVNQQNQFQENLNSKDLKIQYLEKEKYHIEQEIKKKSEQLQKSEKIMQEELKQLKQKQLSNIEETEINDMEKKFEKFKQFYIDKIDQLGNQIDHIKKQNEKSLQLKNQEIDQLKSDLQQFDSLQDSTQHHTNMLSTSDLGNSKGSLHMPKPYQKDLKNLQIEFKKLQDNYSTLSKQLSNKDQYIQQLQEEYQKLTEINEMINFQFQDQSFGEKNFKISKILEINNQLEIEVDILKSDLSRKDILLREQERNLSREIKNLTQKINELEIVITKLEKRNQIGSKNPESRKLHDMVSERDQEIKRLHQMIPCKSFSESNNIKIKQKK